jgi:predicted DNA-binding transcriptional regulator AlpA
MIQGWRELEIFTGLKEHRIRRAIGHYGFPRPRSVQVSQKTETKRLTRTNCWSEDEVLSWLAFPGIRALE